MASDDPDSARSLLARTATGLRRSLARVASNAANPSDSLRFKPVPLRVGDAARAEALIAGQFDFAGQRVDVARGGPWSAEGQSPGWVAALHSFGWLRDLATSNNRESRDTARRLADGWLHTHGKGGAVAWRPAITGDRVTAWLTYAPLLIENAEPVYRSELLRALSSQVRYLVKTADSEPLGHDRLRAAIGAVYGAVCLSSEDELFEAAMDKVIAAAAQDIDSDGVPVSRDGGELLDRLHRLVQLRADLEAANRSISGKRISPFIAAGAPMLRAMRAADGGLALFHGAREEGGERINLALVEARVTDPAPNETAAGLLRLTAGRSSILFDTGMPGRVAHTAHAAPLAFEMGVGRQRVIVNCGSGVHLDGAWETAARGSAAHSTLTLADRSPAQFENSGVGTPPRLRKLKHAPKLVERGRDEDASGIWALGAHDGYVRTHGLIHYRRLFLSADGLDLRGEDTLTLAQSGAATLKAARAALKTPDGPAFAVRFHLHPQVTAQIDGQAVMLDLPNGEQWQLLQAGGRLALEKSVYLPSAVEPIETLQAVIHGALADESAQVQWALKKISPAA